MTGVGRASSAKPTGMSGIRSCPSINNFLEMGCEICDSEYPEGSQEYWRCRTRNSDKGCYDDNTLYSST